MGMDVYGRNPTAPQGEYFRASIDQWPLLAKVIKTLCPQETWPCKHWNSNDGDGLTGPQALALAEALEHKLHTGEVAFALPLARAWQVEDFANEKSFVADFAAFVRTSGGFSIW